MIETLPADVGWQIALQRIEMETEMNFTFNANATSKEDAKSQIRSEQNRDAPDWAKEQVLKRIDATPLSAGHRMRVSMSGNSEDRKSLQVKIETSAS